MGGIVLTNDGNAILREIEVTHPAAKSMIELSRTQDEEVGDGTTSVIILGKLYTALLIWAGEVLANALPYIERKVHPIVIISAYRAALEDAIKAMDEFALPVDTNDDKEMLKIIQSTIGTKFTSRWSALMCELALKAVKTVAIEINGKQEVDIKRYARVEKVNF